MQERLVFSTNAAETTSYSYGKDTIIKLNLKQITELHVKAKTVKL